MYKPMSPEEILRNAREFLICPGCSDPANGVLNSVMVLKGLVYREMSADVKAPAIHHR